MLLDCFCCLRIVRVSKYDVGRISACLRKIGCRCVLDGSQQVCK